MPVGQLADYGVAVFSMALLGWALVAILGPKKRDPDLVKVISDNPQALTKLTAVIESQGRMIEAQGEVLQKQAEILTELRVEIVRKAG